MASAIMAHAADLTAKETAIVDIGAWTARGEQDKLGAAFKAGFDAGLTLNEGTALRLLRLPEGPKRRRDAYED